MTPEDYRRACILFDQLRELPDEERAAALDAACAGNAGLRTEVVRLLEADRDAAGGSFMKGPAIEEAARLLVPARLGSRIGAGGLGLVFEGPCSAGEKLGPYEILSSLGEGGMGQVWKARDTRLNRFVAIKTSQKRFSERFEREAQAIAALNHPHICLLYDVGPDYLVLEYIEGAPLQGPLPVAEALRLAVPIAEALDAAHRKGIVHRDLKPANILVTKSGVKLLDFGLAKMSAATIGEESLTPRLTGEGTILGTMHYMSPEQLQGREADARSDIFAFGLVLYEMLTGKHAFEGASHASLIGAILHTEPPPVSTVVPVAPPALERLIRRCLAKDPDNRWQSARDIAGELQWIAEGGSQAGVPAPVFARERRRERMGWIVATLLALVAIAAGAVAARHLRESPPPRQVVRFQFSFPDGVRMSPDAVPTFSPDGSKIVVVAISGPKRELWLRSLDSYALRPLTGTEGATSGPIFSPDSRSLAFMRGSSLWRLDLASGATQSLCELCGVPPEARATLEREAQPDAWSRDGIILFNQGNVIMQVSASGGAPKPVTELAAGETLHFGGNFLADGRHFLYNVLSGSSPGATNVGFIDDPKFRKQILQRTGQATYTSPGWLLFSRGSVLLAQPFDADKLELSGEPTPVAEPVAGLTPLPGYAYSVSETGSLAWRLGFPSTSMELTWFDRTGKKLGSVGEPGEITNPVLSPDGKRVLITIRDPATKTRDVWILDPARGTNSRLTFDPAEDHNPVWSPDGAYVIFSSSRKGHHDIYRKRADGVGAEEELLVSEVDKGVDSLSPDGKLLLYNVQGPGGRSSIWSLPLTGDGKSTPVVTGPYLANFGQFSPNGRWIAYTSTESGRNQVFVCSAPGFGVPAGKWQVSMAGTMPQWRRDGKELFFLDGDKLMAVPVRSDGTLFDSGTPVQMFTARRGLSLRNHFTVSADGQRFLFASPTDTGKAGEVHVILNWPALLKRN
ncbi:Serine/threonine protein kinase [Candidatus Sulfopaludibacter sp. SbA4]|nr:Serine/threonine protein kinase [Candidatus Sulfopaludibacter sp. SbA4]